MIKAGDIFRLGDVTKLIQTQRRMQHLSTEELSIPFPKSPHGRRSGGMTPGNF